ncbi:MAG: hypothetical protein E2O41_06625 [Nitrospina sp.]|nr:MAG: hypothetical protein E2O41_06625 [Nitrospina sp.]
MKDCRCGMSFPYTDCCGPLIRGAIFADTAEDLMRSRYTATTQGNWDYLIQTTCADERPHKSPADFEKGDIEWLGLEILGTRQGERHDAAGEVTFVARYREAGEANELQETSKFIKENGRWMYSEKQSTVHAAPTPSRQPVKRSSAKVGRNAPCPCGSGKKYKKCCG